MTAGSISQTTGNPLDRLDAEQREAALLLHLASEVATACDAFLKSNDPIAMINRQIAHQGKPDTSPRRWVRKKADIGPAPSMKPDWKAIVRQGIAAGLVTPPKREP